MIYDKNKKKYNIQEILAILPQRFPFIMIDRIVDFTPGDK